MVFSIVHTTEVGTKIWRFRSEHEGIRPSELPLTGERSFQSLLRVMAEDDLIELISVDIVEP